MQEDLEVKSCLETLCKNNLFPIRKLGKGGFGSVYLVSRGSNKGGEGELLAVKCTNKKNFARQPLLRKYLKQEIDVQGNVRHPNIVKLMRAFDDEGWNFMVMEYCEMGNLYTIQSQKQTKAFELNQAKKLMLQILDGLFHLHSKSIIHRDLKPENILLSKIPNRSDMRVKICDFGFAKETEEETSTFCGTTYFMAPEILAKRKYDSSVDVWAAGVIYFYMIFGIFPFKSLNMFGEIESKCKDGFDLMSIKGIEQFSYLNEDLKILRKLFSEIFTLDPSRRIAIGEFRRIILQERNKVEDEELMSTIETDSDDEKEILEHISQQIVFIQKVYQQIKNMKFINELEELALKYYLDKYCLTLLMSTKGSGANQTMTKMKNELINNQNSECAALQANLSKVGISKLPELFSGMKWTNFSDYKEEYRVVLSHCFSKASKTIQNSKIKSEIKLKLFCCHSINRVFDQQYIFCIFTHFFNSHRSNQYKLNDILKWIEKETEEKINDTVRILCDRFYPKGK